MSTTILDPTGHSPEQLRRTHPATHRLADIRGLTIGLLENTKHNAALLLDELADHLIRDYNAAEVVRRTKTQFALPITVDLLAELKAECDVVITGVGDCGSCSASAVADGIAFEEAGLPAAVICTDAFHTTAGAMADMKGDPDYRYLVTEHPVAILDPAEVRSRAKQLLPDVISLLTALQTEPQEVSR